MKSSFVSVLIILFLLFSAAVFGQSTQPLHQHGASPTPTPKPDDAMQDMPGMQHSTDHQQPMTFINDILLHSTAGTSAQPNSIDKPMIMRVHGKWMFMFHG